jgi:site-specific recombinase XerD
LFYVNDFYDEQLERVKAMTVTKYHANISKALKYAVKKNYIPHTFMEKVNRPSTKRFVGKFLKQSEVVELFEAVKGNKLELGVILGAFYSLRRSEAYVKQKLKICIYVLSSKLMLLGRDRLASISPLNITHVSIISANVKAILATFHQFAHSQFDASNTLCLQ